MRFVIWTQLYGHERNTKSGTKVNSIMHNPNWIILRKNVILKIILSTMPIGFLLNYIYIFLIRCQQIKQLHPKKQRHISVELDFFFILLHKSICLHKNFEHT